MVRIYTLTLAPSLDSATITPQIYPEGKLRCTAPVFEPGGGEIKQFGYFITVNIDNHNRQTGGLRKILCDFINEF